MSSKKEETIWDNRLYLSTRDILTLKEQYFYLTNSTARNTVFLHHYFTCSYLFHHDEQRYCGQISAESRDRSWYLSLSRSANTNSCHQIIVTIVLLFKTCNIIVVVFSLRERVTGTNR